MIFNYLRSLKESATHRRAKDAGILTLSQYLAAILGFLTAVVTARILGPSDYGSVALIIAFPDLLWSFVGTKSISVTTKYMAAMRAQNQYLEFKAICKLGYGVDFLMSSLAFFFILISSWWVATNIYKMPELGWIMAAYSISIPFTSLTGTSWAIFTSYEKFGILAVFQIFWKATILIFILAFLYFGFGVVGVVAGTAIGDGITGIIMLIAATKTLYRNGLGNWWNVPISSVKHLRNDILSFFGWNYLIVTLNGMLMQVPLMLLGRIRGSEEAGYYRLAMTIVTSSSYLEGSLKRVVYPVLSARWGAGERTNIFKSLSKWTIQGGLILGTFLIILIPLLYLIIPIVFGDEFKPMVLGTQLMMVGSAISAIFFWLESFYYSSGNVSIWGKAFSISVLLVIASSYFIANSYGFTGVASLISAIKILFIITMVNIILQFKPIWK